MRALIFMLFVSLVLVSCENNPTQSSVINDSFSENRNLIESNVKDFEEIEAIEIVRARILINTVKLNPVQDNGFEFISAPKILDINPKEPINKISLYDIPAGTYDRANYNVNPLDPTDPNNEPYIKDPEFRDFVGEENLSVIIEGIVIKTGNISEEFIFESKLKEIRLQHLNPYLKIISEPRQVFVQMILSTKEWFIGTKGELLDPLNTNNKEIIEDNIKGSIRLKTDYPNKFSDNLN